jgi:AcrR family transcriptional regulator
MSTTSSSQRRPRADARRNYERLLAEADAIFREHGTDASLESVARGAGVAIGTLYSHFPNRRALVCAVLQERNDALFERGETLLTVPSAGEALVIWIRAVVAHGAIYRGLAALLADGVDDAASELYVSCQRMTKISDRHVINARRAGAIRPEVTGADVFALMNAAAWTCEHASPSQADRFITFALEGLLQHSTSHSFRSGGQDGGQDDVAHSPIGNKQLDV